jgi:hypothetical protein
MSGAALRRKTMKTRTYLIGAALAAILTCTSVHAQVLGGSLGGAVGGTLNGGLSSMDVMGDTMIGGNANGSLGDRIETDSIHRTTRDVRERATDRTQDTVGRVRDRAESTATHARDVGTHAAASAAGTTKDTVEAQKQKVASTEPPLSADADASASGRGSISASPLGASLDAEPATEQPAVTPVPAPTPASQPEPSDRPSRGPVER